MGNLSIRTQFVALTAACLVLIAALSVAVVAGARSDSAAWLVLALAVVLLSAVLHWWFARRLQKEFARLACAVRSLADGDLTARLESRACAETIALGQEFNGAQQRLHALLERVQAAARQLLVASGEISQGHADLSARTEQQASSLEEAATAMEQMTATVSQNAQNAKRVSEHASAAAEVAKRGGQAVAGVVGTMMGISDSSGRISDIIAVIDGIAFQTNILALNAAVEAARAGEQGRGFAVVAAEVRSLAQRSATASREIRQLIQDSVGRVDAGSREVEEAGETMAEIVTAVKRVHDLIAEISSASQEQSHSLHQVSETVQQLEKVTQQNAAMVERASTVSASMAEQAASLAHALGRFKLRDGVHHGPATRQVPRPLQAAVTWRDV
ncbi:MAG TPA: methyl-accepting chemotaxis protein [Burkholderiales bacterium]|nr:methyl-accepting chemotaxis protein [Burkholderiales bacterium]